MRTSGGLEALLPQALSSLETRRDAKAALQDLFGGELPQTAF
jgi:hypothetical protein